MSVAEKSQDQVDQSPTAVIKHAGEALKLSCNHSSSRFDMIQWFKQSAGKNEMVLMGYVRFSLLVVEEPFKETHNVSGTGGKQSSLHFLKLDQWSDSAMYFCAASEARCYTHPLPPTKTFSDGYKTSKVTT